MTRHEEGVASRLERQGERVHARSRVHTVTYVFACVYGGGARVQRVALCHNVAVLGARVRAAGSGSMTLACTRNMPTTLEFRYTRTARLRKNSTRSWRKEIRTL